MNAPSVPVRAPTIPSRARPRTRAFTWASTGPVAAPAPRFLTASMVSELGILLALSLLFPFLIHLVPVPDDVRLGPKLLPMFYAPLLGALLGRTRSAILVALAAPWLNWLLTSHPAPLGAVVMSLQLAVFVGVMRPPTSPACQSPPEPRRSIPLSSAADRPSRGPARIWSPAYRASSSSSASTGSPSATCPPDPAVAIRTPRDRPLRTRGVSRATGRAIRPRAGSRRDKSAGRRTASGRRSSGSAAKESSPCRARRRAPRSSRCGPRPRVRTR